MTTKHPYLITRRGRRVTPEWLVLDGDDGAPDSRRLMRLTQGAHVRDLTDAEAVRAESLPHTDVRRATTAHVVSPPASVPPHAVERRTSVPPVTAKKKSKAKKLG